MQQIQTNRNMCGRFFLNILMYVPFILVCSVIFWLSSMSHPPVPPFFKFHNGDKLLHVIAFFFVGFSAVLPLGLQTKHFKFWLSVRALGLALLYGIVDEVHQSYVPYRNSSTLDLTADLVGALMGIFVFWMIASVLRSIKAQ